ncbi:TetR/AcrR family transcriptional regulator [Nocardiopsis sp. CNR-923]|uniref:TetR/AcrR family transcriptional regulator n=1 Tax=Nocardiopsis sp. CNR-923 TaxID=1904965 RepID=UPI000AC1C081|nr:helix-turn-helix domain-containing protein [Nocardiopsis sp. CNR-923]
MDQTRTRARTRRAILEAAVEVLGDNSAAPLSEVARTAGVARSTLQRYFPERSDLTRALGEYVEELVNEATVRARTTDGTAIEAFSRLVAEYFGARKAILAAFGDQDVPREPAECESGPADLALYDLVERGHEDGTIDPRITPLWAQQLLWSGLYAGAVYVNVARVPAFEALNMCLLSLVKAVSDDRRA